MTDLYKHVLVYHQVLTSGDCEHPGRENLVHFYEYLSSCINGSTHALTTKLFAEG